MVIQLYHRNLISGTDFDSTISSLGFTTKYRIETYKIKKNLPTMSGLVRARPGSSGLVRARPGSSGLVRAHPACLGLSRLIQLVWTPLAHSSSSGLFWARPGSSGLVQAARCSVRGSPKSPFSLGTELQKCPMEEKNLYIKFSSSLLLLLLLLLTTLYLDRGS